MLDPLRKRLCVAEHHGRRTDATHPMPNPHHVKPIVGHDLTSRDRRSNAIDQDFRASAGDTTKPRSFESLENGLNRKLVHFREMVQLGRAESVDVHIWIMGFDVPQQIGRAHV